MTDARASTDPPGDLEHLPIGQVAGSLGTDPDRGLAADEAAQRLARYGPNGLPDRHRSVFGLILG
ncbi:MAG: hypothetical protein JNK88_09705, partial [Mangrovicoccus sp.]|nr:hypothetical protein [Mangrovicoccus sp.]